MASTIINLVRGSAMKKLLLGTAMSMAVAAGAAAADLDFKAPPPMRSWTGCFVGGNVGAGFSWISDTDVPAGPPPQVVITNPGFVGGGQVGCDVQFYGRWVIGAAGEFEAAGINGSAIIPATGLPATS